MEQFVETHLKLIELERTAEIEETRVLTEKLPPKELQRRGVCLLKLHISGRKTGLYGRTILFFEAAGGIKEFPSHSITSGDIVGLCQVSGDPTTDSVGSGVVTKVTQTEVGVAFDDGQDLSDKEDDAVYKLTKLANDVTYKRIKDALNRLRQAHTLPCSRLASVLFQESELSPPFDSQEIYFVNDNLDESQREAVKFSLCQPEVAVVHGPPGTGKTTTVIEIIIQAVKQGKKILACAPSNIAVDNLVERLAANKQKIVRLGHPARVLHHIQKYSLDAILSTSNETRLVEDVRSDMDKTMAKMKKSRDRGERQRFREDLKSLKKELIQREQTAIKQILTKADVVLATMTSASWDGPLKFLDEKHFDLGIVDECSQAIEAACWIPLLRIPRCILAGDHLQLPPTILSNEAAKTGLEMTLMERVLGIYGNQVMRMLTTQYRMNHMIMQWSSDQLYDGKLVAHPSVSEHLLRDLPGIEDNDDTCQPLLFVDTAGCELYELDLPEEISKGNEGEADIVTNHVERLISYGLKQEDIAVIAPYNLQVELLRLRLSPNYPKVEVKSVDGFQGREKEAVLISLVRSNPKGEVGFLAERRRINVAITRARRHLMVVCDSETVGHDKFLKSLVDYMTVNGEVQTAHHYVEDGIANAKLVRPDHLNDLLSIKTTTPKGQGAKPKQKQKSKQTEKSQNHQRQGDKTENRTGKPSDRVTDEEMLKRKTEEYQQYLDKFVADVTQSAIEFPASLNSYDRLILHELSEKMGLIHVSQGENKERHLVVSKPGVKNNKESKEDTELVASNKEEEVKGDSNGSTTDSDKLVCKYCSKDVIKANFSLHEIHCLRKQKEASQAANNSKNRKDSSKNRMDNSKRPASGKKGSKQTAEKDAISKLQNVDPDDFDALISASKDIDSKCVFQKCKVKTATLGHTCQFCMRRFCLNHSMAEVHGCGDAIKAQARATIVKEGVLYRGSGVPSKLPDPTRKALLEKKMEKKLTEMEADRQRKKKKK